MPAPAAPEPVAMDVRPAATEPTAGAPAGPGPAAPAQAPPSPELPATTRRQQSVALSTAGAAQQVGDSALSGDSITVDPTVVWGEGVLSGTLDASTASGDRLSYVVISKPSLGGKIGGGRCCR